MPVNEAAKLLGVSRPTLSKLLNGKSALSSKMASRLEKAFRASPRELMQIQAEYDQLEQLSIGRALPVGLHVPQFLKMTAKDIEQWAGLEARSLLAVLLRRLVNSTSPGLSQVDFPGFDNAEKKGWDGRIETSTATPWIPFGKSGWEFGCSQDQKRKADEDYAARVRELPAHERSESNFVFVTPRKWNGKEKWVKEKRALGEWKSVTAHDSNNLEQWLEQSIQAQVWLAEQMGKSSEGVHSLEERWQSWASVTTPALSKELFTSSVERHKEVVKTWIESPPSSPLIVCGDSKLEALAFLHCLFDSDEPTFKSCKDRMLVFSSAQALRKLTTTSPSFIPIVFTDEVERELGGTYKNCHTIIVRPRNTMDPEPTIVLDLLKHEGFRKALEAMGINDYLKAEDLARESGRSPTILRRRLAKAPAVRTPAWAQDSQAIGRLIPMMLVGAWHTQSKGDVEIMSFLGTQRNDLEKDVVELLKFDDPPIWSVGKYRGVTSKIDAFFAVQNSITPRELETFLFAAEVVLSEQDPALDLPEDKRAFASLFGKSREHSGALRDGICETLVLLAVHGNNLFKQRTGMNVASQIDSMIRRLLTPLTPEKLLSQASKLPLYAEAAPLEFLRIVEEDLKCAKPQVFALMKPADTGFLGGGCPRTGLLWALEMLAWKSEQLTRVTLILARLSEQKINDNWNNKPENSLQAIFRCWMPQTAAPLDDRKMALERLVQKYPAVGWRVCTAQFRSRTGDYSSRPRWRSDAAEAGQPVNGRETHEFRRKAFDLLLAWPSYDEHKLGDLVKNIQEFPHETQEKVWDLIDNWTTQETGETNKAVLRETIRKFAFARRGARRELKTETRNRAGKAYDLLTPTDPVTRNQWLFAQQWLEESYEEAEQPLMDYQVREENVREMRISALQEIREAKGFEGMLSLISQSGAASDIGYHMAAGVVKSLGDASEFLEQCLKAEDKDLVEKLDQVVRGFLYKLDAGLRVKVTEHLLKALPEELVCRFLKCSLFEHDTWVHVDGQGPQIREQYWQQVNPNWLMKNSPDLHEVIDRLLEARRPRAAFHSVHFALEEIETSRLKRLVLEIGTNDSEAPEAYQLRPHYVSEALNLLQGRPGVSEEEMAQLEFPFITALEYTTHRIPNLERQLGKSPALFVQALAMVYRRNDGGEDPPEWKVKEAEHRSAIGMAADRLLENARRIPGTDNRGKIDAEYLKAWVKEAQSLCLKLGRAEIGDTRIGQLLSAPVLGTDGVWPCEEVRSALEACGTSDMATGVCVGVYNSRGAHMRAEGGEQERDLAGKYRNWSRKIAFDCPYVADILGRIAAEYDKEAEMWDAEDAVGRRLRF